MTISFIRPARLLFITAVIAGCGRQQPQETSGVPDAPLVIVSNATDVRRTHEYDGALYYLVEDPYPGGMTIDNITRAIATTPEWQPSNEHPLSRDNPDTRSWGSSYEASGAKVYQWTGAWKNSRGDMVTYVLRYEVTDPNAIAHTMKVSAISMTAATVGRLRKLADSESVK